MPFEKQRLFDLIIATPLLVFSLPLFVLIALLVHLSSPGPVFFRQPRLGRGGQLFRIFKFRTMFNSSGGGTAITIAGDSRITPFGKILRRTKLDELPQLLNVLRGEMGLVGPRPEVPAYRHVYQNGFEKVLQVRPGITDPASLTLIDEEQFLREFPDPLTAYEEIVLPRKLMLSLDYLQQRRLRDDLRIIFLTILFALGVRLNHSSEFIERARTVPQR